MHKSGRKTLIIIIFNKHLTYAKASVINLGFLLLILRVIHNLSHFLKIADRLCIFVYISVCVYIYIYIYIYIYQLLHISVVTGATDGIGKGYAHEVGLWRDYANLALSTACHFLINSVSDYMHYQRWNPFYKEIL